jgi:hypothetical protein
MTLDPNRALKRHNLQRRDIEDRDDLSVFIIPGLERKLLERKLLE